MSAHLERRATDPVVKDLLHSIASRMPSFEANVIERLARIEEKTDSAAAANKDHEERIRGLERRMWTVGGAAAVVGAVLTKVSMSMHIPFPWGS